jgi:transposase
MDRLAILAQQVLEEDPFGGALFAFRGKRGGLIKLLCFDGQGHETMTGAQASYLKTLCEEAGEEFDASLSKAEASKRIDVLQATTGRGKMH